jgi:hypothetical protein
MHEQDVNHENTFTATHLVCFLSFVNVVVKGS